MKLIFKPCCEFQWSPEDPVSQIHSPHLQAGAPGIFSDLLRSVQMLKREWSAESNGKLPHLFIPNKTATLVPDRSVDDLPLRRTVALVPKFAVKNLPLGRTLWWWYAFWSSILNVRFTLLNKHFIPRWLKKYFNYCCNKIYWGHNETNFKLYLWNLHTIRDCTCFMWSTQLVPWLSYSPLEPRFAGSNPAWVDGLFRA